MSHRSPVARRLAGACVAVLATGVLAEGVYFAAFAETSADAAPQRSSSASSCDRADTVAAVSPEPAVAGETVQARLRIDRTLRWGERLVLRRQVVAGARATVPVRILSSQLDGRRFVVRFAAPAAAGTGAVNYRVLAVRSGTPAAEGRRVGAFTATITEPVLALAFGGTLQPGAPAAATVTSLPVRPGREIGLRVRTARGAEWQVLGTAVQQTEVVPIGFIVPQDPDGARRFADGYPIYQAFADDLGSGDDDDQTSVVVEAPEGAAQPTETVTVTASPTATPTATVTATQTATVTAGPATTPAQTVTVTASPSSTPTATVTQTAIQTATAPAQTVTVTASPSSTPTVTETATVTASPSTVYVTTTAYATATATEYATQTAYATETVTSAPTATTTRTVTVAPTATQTVTATVTTTPIYSGDFRVTC